MTQIRWHGFSPNRREKVRLFAEPSATTQLMAERIKPAEDKLFENLPEKVKELQQQAARERRQKQREEWFKRHDFNRRD